MTLPRIGATKIDNCIATLLLSGNSSHHLNLDRIAAHQRFDAAEFRARFAHLETVFSLKPTNSFEGPEGK